MIHYFYYFFFFYREQSISISYVNELCYNDYSFFNFYIFIIGVIITAVECSFFKLNVYLYVFTFILIRLTS